MHGSAPWETEETIVGLPRLLVLSVLSRSDSPDLVAVTFHLTARRSDTPSRSMSRVRQRIWLPASSWLIAGTSQSHSSVSRALLTACWNALRRGLCSLYSSLPNPESSPDAVVSGSQRMNGKIPLRNPLRMF